AAMAKVRIEPVSRWLLEKFGAFDAEWFRRQLELEFALPPAELFLLHRLVVDRTSNSITLDGLTYPGLDPCAVAVVDALLETKTANGDRPVPFSRLQELLPGCNHESTLRRWVERLPEAIQRCIKGKRGQGRWLEVPRLIAHPEFDTISIDGIPYRDLPSLVVALADTLLDREALAKTRAVP